MLLQISAATTIRLARPTQNLEAAERFYGAGLGLSVLYRNNDPEEYASILIMGLPHAAWHLEFARPNGHVVVPMPTEEDLLVLYLGEKPSEETIQRLLENGGQRVAAPNPYWEQWGVTIRDPDGYRVVLCERQWAK